MADYAKWAQQFGTSLSSLLPPIQGTVGGGFNNQAPGGAPPVAVPPAGPMMGRTPGIIPQSAPGPQPAPGGFAVSDASTASAGAAFQKKEPEAEEGGKLTFQKMWRDGTDGEKGKFLEQFEKQGVDVDMTASQIAQQDPELVKKWGDPTELSKKEKAGLLMEWGLRMMQASANTGSLGGAFAEAGLGTLGSQRAMVEKKKTDQQAAIQRQEDFGLDQRRVAASEMSAEAAAKQAEAAIARSAPGYKELIKGDNGNALAVMPDGSTKDTGVQWNDSMGGPNAKAPSAFRDRYNLFKESIQVICMFFP